MRLCAKQNQQLIILQNLNYLLYMTTTNPSRYLCRPLLKLDGKDAPAELMKDLLQISLEESLHLPAMFTIVVHNTYLPGRNQDRTWRHEKLFKLGDRLTIGFAASTTEAQAFSEEIANYLIDGEITAIEVNFTSKSEAHIVIRGYDVSHRLHRGRYNRSFLNETDSDIVKKLLKK
jgi:hypothetical protein